MRNAARAASNFDTCATSKRRRGVHWDTSIFGSDLRTSGSVWVRASDVVSTRVIVCEHGSSAVRRNARRNDAKKSARFCAHRFACAERRFSEGVRARGGGIWVVFRLDFVLSGSNRVRADRPALQFGYSLTAAPDALRSRRRTVICLHNAATANRLLPDRVMIAVHGTGTARGCDLVSPDDRYRGERPPS